MNLDAKLAVDRIEGAIIYPVEFKIVINQEKNQFALHMLDIDWYGGSGDDRIGMPKSVMEVQAVRDKFIALVRNLSDKPRVPSVENMHNSPLTPEDFKVNVLPRGVGFGCPACPVEPTIPHRIYSRQFWEIPPPQRALLDLQRRLATPELTQSRRGAASASSLNEDELKEGFFRPTVIFPAPLPHVPNFSQEVPQQHPQHLGTTPAVPGYSPAVQYQNSPANLAESSAVNHGMPPPPPQMDCSQALMMHQYSVAHMTQVPMTQAEAYQLHATQLNIGDGNSDAGGEEGISSSQAPGTEVCMVNPAACSSATLESGASGGEAGSGTCGGCGGGTSGGVGEECERFECVASSGAGVVMSHADVDVHSVLRECLSVP